MDLRFSPADEAFREQVRAWLEDNLRGEFALLRGRGGPGDEHACFEERLSWERRLGEAGWIGLGWPTSCGGRGASLMEQVIFNEEYARARAPGRLSHIGETLLAPTLIAFGTEAQKSRILPAIRRAEALWCQGYSEPNAGSDLANIQTRATLLPSPQNQWSISGQKTWTSLAQWAHWAFVLCRTDPAAPRHQGISYILVPMNQPGVEVRPIRQMTGTSEFNEVFFDDARADAADVVGPVNGGWKVAMGTLAFERGASTLGQQLSFQNELAEIIAIARANGRIDDPPIRRRLVDAWMGLKIMRLNALRTLSDHDTRGPRREAMITKLHWATWHRDMGKLAMDVLGAESEIAAEGELTALQRLFLFSRSDTIYAGTNEIQRNIIAERALGLPREPRP